MNTHVRPPAAFGLLQALARLALPFGLFAHLALLALIAVLPLRAHGAAPAGLQIGNQASATYTDASAVSRTVTSNTVLTTVQQVASVSLAAPSSKTISPGGQVYYPHTLVNTGNGPDSYTLSQNNSGSFSFTSVLFYADVNGDGVPDNAVPITSTGALAAGQTFKFVAAGIVPPTAVAGNSNTLVLTATSAFNGAVTASLNDSTTVTGQAVVGVTQGLDVTQGPSPSSGRTITINYTNTGNSTASALTLTEALPAGMVYVPNSARWSVTGAGTVLTDADASDNQSGIVYDYGVTVGGRVTAVIANVPAGASGTLSFQVDIASGLPAGANAATASTVRYGYHDGAATVPATNGNTVQYTVQSSAAVALQGATVGSAVQGGTVSFTNIVTNNGNGSDSFDLSTGTSNFPAGTTFLYFRADGVTPLLDTNGNGAPDTGPLAAGASFSYVMKAVLPPNATGGPYTVQARATSVADPSKQATANNVLSSITSSTLDLTNDSAGPTAPGYGPGVEAQAVQTLATNPGGTVRFTLVAANSSATSDTYGLQASTDSSFATTTLPAGWTVVFKNAAGALIDNTGLIGSGANKTVYADVTVPAGAAAGTTQLYFRALSPTTGAGDRLHDAVTVNLLRGLTLSPNNLGQATPAGTTVYTHVITNAGSTLEGDGVGSVGTLTVSNTAPGFTAVIYWDKNNDGVLDANDPVVSDLAALTGGSNGASTAPGLDVGESARLFVKVTAPAGAPAGSANVTTLTATLTGTINSVVAPQAVSATDTSNVMSSQLTLVIMQALDAACDGVADYAVTIAPITNGAPGACVRYEVTATNAGPATLSDVVVNVPTPAYTTYTITVPAAGSSGTVTAPADGATGQLTLSLPSLAPGASVVLRYGVRINP